MEDSEPADIQAGQTLEKAWRACIFLHQNSGVRMGADEASLRIALSEGLGKIGIGVTRGIVHTLIYDDMDQLENGRVYLIANNAALIDIRIADVLHEYHCEQMARLLAHRNIPVGIVVNFNEELFEPEMERVVNRSYKAVDL
jgi:GxxExxY protein